ncbi:MAG: hypothetical protein KJ737_22955 [Proteobacteria bacterium]|nr:hypothetical protein [Pseudomonadota bacterium]
MDPRDFYTLAEELVNKKPLTQADLRSAVGRAYYAAFNVAAEHLRKMGFTPSKGPNGHGDVQRKFSNCGNDDVALAAKNLSDLHGQRINADYKLNYIDIEKEPKVRLLLYSAQKIIKALDDSCKKYQEEIKDSIIGYENSINKHGNE